MCVDTYNIHSTARVSVVSVYIDICAEMDNENTTVDVAFFFILLYCIYIYNSSNNDTNIHNNNINNNNDDDS